MTRFKTVCIGIVALMVVSGCASTVDVNVNSIVDPQLTPPGKRYVLSSETKEDDLFFREFSRYFDTVLQDAGYTKVSDRNEADLDIQFKFGISDGRTGVYTFTSPIYDFIGGETITITESTPDGSGQKVTTIRIPPRFERIGTSLETRNYTLYNRMASLQARALSETKSTAEVDSNPLVWSLYIYSVGESNDLRRIMPYLAAAAAPYIGKNSGQLVTVGLKADNPEVVRLQQLTLH